MPKQIDNSLTSQDRTLAHALLRVSLATTILLHGVVRLIAGPNQFADGMAKQFASTPLPTGLVHSFGFVLPFLEASIGALLLLGVQLRWTLVAGALLMVVLIFGSTLRGDFQIVGLQLIYAVVYFLLLFTRDYDGYSAGPLFRNRRIRRDTTDSR